MLRLTIISSVVPLVLAGGVVHDWTSASAFDCLATAAPAIRRVAFTDDPALATVRVQLVDGAELADFVVAEDSTAADPPGCSFRDMARTVVISDRPVAGEPVVYLSRASDADYRIYVDSKQVSAEQVAALIVGARGGQMRLAAQPFDHEPTGSIGR